MEGEPVRLLSGDWEELCATVAAEVLRTNPTSACGTDPLDAAVLMFSTSEKNTRNHNAPGSDLRIALERRGLRVYNPRNKTAGRVGSAVHDLVALVSYLIDPVRRARVNGRVVDVYASHLTRTAGRSLSPRQDAGLTMRMPRSRSNSARARVASWISPPRAIGTFCSSSMTSGSAWSQRLRRGLRW